MFNALEYRKLSQESLSSQIVREDLFKAFHRIVFLRGNMLYLHYLAIGAFTQFLNFSKQILWHLEILI